MPSADFPSSLQSPGADTTQPNEEESDEEDDSGQLDALSRSASNNGALLFNGRLGNDANASEGSIVRINRPDFASATEDSGSSSEEGDVSRHRSVTEASSQLRDGTYTRTTDHSGSILFLNDSNSDIPASTSVVLADNSVVFTDNSVVFTDDSNQSSEPKALPATTPLNINLEVAAGNRSRNNSEVNRDYLFIQMELCQKANLGTWLRENKVRDKVLVIEFFWAMINAVEHVHSQGLMHRDLKVRQFIY